jgi:hypothetical protein
MNTQRPRKPWNWVWPNVDTTEAAEWAAKQAFWAAVLLMASNAAFALLAVARVGVFRTLGFGAYSLIDGAIFGAIAFGLWKYSRLAAWAGLLLYIFPRAYTLIAARIIKSPIIAAIFILAFVSGVRGTSALDTLKRIELRKPRSDAI